MSRRLEIQVGEFVCPADVLMSRAKSVGRPVDLGQRTRGLTKLQGSMTLKMHFARMSAERARMVAQVYRENSLLPSPSWLWVRTSAISCFQKVLTVTKRVKSLISSDLSCQRPYHAECTGSRPITEVKQHRASSVLGWVTAWEHGVLLANQLFFCYFPSTLTFWEEKLFRRVFS